jgi:ubiquinone/menaquinone biosynthesis C-methylase UbiE
VACVKGTFEDSTLPAKSVDLVFVRNAYHDIANRTEYFSRLRPALKKGGRVAIIDYLPGGFFRRIYGHYIRPEKIVSEMNAAGYEAVRRFDFLEKQSFQIFKAR